LPFIMSIQAFAKWRWRQKRKGSRVSYINITVRQRPSYALVKEDDDDRGVNKNRFPFAPTSSNSGPTLETQNFLAKGGSGRDFARASLPSPCRRFCLQNFALSASLKIRNHEIPLSLALSPQPSHAVNPFPGPPPGLAFIHCQPGLARALADADGDAHAPPVLFCPSRECARTLSSLSPPGET